jgi:hypothetical protein
MGFILPSPYQAFSVYPNESLEIDARPIANSPLKLPIEIWSTITQLICQINEKGGDFRAIAAWAGTCRGALTLCLVISEDYRTFYCLNRLEKIIPQQIPRPLFDDNMGYLQAIGPDGTHYFHKHYSNQITIIEFSNGIKKQRIALDKFKLQGTVGCHPTSKGFILVTNKSLVIIGKKEKKFVIEEYIPVPKHRTRDVLCSFFCNDRIFILTGTGKYGFHTYIYDIKQKIYFESVMCDTFPLYLKLEDLIVVGGQLCLLESMDADTAQCTALEEYFPEGELTPQSGEALPKIYFKRGEEIFRFPKLILDNNGELNSTSIKQITVGAEWFLKVEDNHLHVFDVVNKRFCFRLKVNYNDQFFIKNQFLFINSLLNPTRIIHLPTQRDYTETFGHLMRQNIYKIWQLTFWEQEGGLFLDLIDGDTKVSSPVQLLPQSVVTFNKTKKINSQNSISETQQAISAKTPSCTADKKIKLLASAILFGGCVAGYFLIAFQAGMPVYQWGSLVLTLPAILTLGGSIGTSLVLFAINSCRKHYFK